MRRVGAALSGHEVARASGVGSLPSTDYGEAVAMVFGEMDLPFIPELPARGAGADMIGRTLGLLDEFGADLQPAGWRIGVGRGVDQRRARSLLAADLDIVEEHVAAQFDGDLARPIKTQVVGPLTLAANVELPRGEKVLADHGARAELAEALGLAISRHIADLRRRTHGPEIWIQIDEPSAAAVLAGDIRTDSGFSRYRTVQPGEAADLMRHLTSAICDAGARAVVHSCAANFPIGLIGELQVAALSFDLGLARPTDEWSVAIEAGVALWPGVGFPDELDRARFDHEVSAQVLRISQFVAALGFADDQVPDSAVVTPACGLAAVSPSFARSSLAACGAVARRLSSGDSLAQSHPRT